ncbi:hypothetical protein [Desulfobacter latus]|uniref:CopG family transcriptional regulator n=1 Tax=Desulfobacter latus TaxID=2292 RepID=A0A850TH06_9BACT|nr:hypothetical protein [Desulfobacter latus]NWH06856.1 hypothetical protein [Desulfobacter latus]
MSRRKKPMNRPAPSATPTTSKISEPVSVSLRLSPTLSKKLDSYCSEIGASRNGVISVAIADFLAERISN